MKLFSKSFRHQGRAALVASRTRRNKASAFLFNRFFFAPPLCKEKPTMEFMKTNTSFALKKLLATFSFGIVGAKEKVSKKKSAANGGLCPSTPPPFEKGGRKLF
ncbi:MAG: hypothetical protein E7659_02385 [Ruminococcaceae bacterium]|nr:hypothetical protein [Oscillospiraceae bacterium]